jgi:glucokinase
MTAKARHPTLVADIGGTHVRFGLETPAGIEGAVTLRCADYASLTDAARSFVAQGSGPRPRRAAFAVAGPVQGDTVRMTNHVWTFSIEGVRQELDLDRLKVLNDFAALALALPALSGKDLTEVKTGSLDKQAPKGVLGPGTGLGVAALVPAGKGWKALTTEGGHRDLAAQSEREWQIVRQLRERFEHVSVERVLSGPGLANLYEAISRLSDTEPQSLTPAAVVAGAREGSEPACVEATQLFSSWLGAVASDLAVTLGAFGGIYLGGGILPKMGKVFDADRFRERFLAKGRFRDYLRPIPVYLITLPHATLVGAARALTD